MRLQMKTLMFCSVFAYRVYTKTFGSKTLMKTKPA